MTSIPRFDRDSCTLCGKCVTVCPENVLTIDNSAVSVSTDACMLCSHCYAVCSSNAVSFDPDMVRSPEFSSFNFIEKITAPGNAAGSELVNIVRARRSIRKYRERPVDDGVIADLVSFAVTAPSGSNRQEWEFLAVNGRDKVWNLALQIRNFFIKLNKLARNPVIRYGSALVAGTALIIYYRERIDTVEMAIQKSSEGTDLLFHGAPALIILHGKPGGSTPVEDAQYAAYNITLLAHALGLGTCFIGYAVESMNRAKFIRQYCGIPAGNRIHAVLTVGYPDVEFYRQALRKKYPLRFL